MLTVRYTLTRDEVWRWYWKAWRRGLWMAHVFAAFTMVLAFTVYGVGGSVGASIGLGLLAALSLSAVMIGYPQLRFRPEERTLTADADGLNFVRGTQTGRVPWKAVRFVRLDEGNVVITGRSLSAFIIPGRAFASVEKATSFAEFAQARIKA